MADWMTLECASMLSERTMDRDEVLGVLSALLERAESPVIRECLRCARGEIAYLTSTEGFELEQAENAAEPHPVLFREK